MTINVVDKALLGMSGLQAYIGVEVGQVNHVVLMCGDPFRVQLIADQLEDVVEIAHRREYRMVNGYYKGRPITACSHGVGCPSTAIAVEETSPRRRKAVHSHRKLCGATTTYQCR